MSNFRGVLGWVGIVCLAAPLAQGAAEPGLLAHWAFDEGQGAVAQDSSGNGHKAAIQGASWVKQGKGFAIAIDGEHEQYVDAGPTKALGITGPVTVEAWVLPQREARGESSLIGEGMRSFLMTYSPPETCYWYIGHGQVSNYASAQLSLDQWQHVAATFDGHRLALWINGRQVASKKSDVAAYELAGDFLIGTRGRPDLPRFKGLIDNVRIYNRALGEQDLLAHIQQEGGDYGLAVGAAAPVARSDSTRFFESHPNAIDVEERGDSILFANRRVGIEILRSRDGIQLSRLYGIAEKQDFLAADKGAGLRNLFEVRMTLDPARVGRDWRGTQRGSIMGIIEEMAGDAFPIGSRGAASVSWRREGDQNESTLHLECKGMDARENKGVLDVEVTVRLRKDDPLTYWRIAVKNRSLTYGIERVRFPILDLAPIGRAEDDVFAYPLDRGALAENPFNQPTGFNRGYNTTGAYYPYNFNMQFQALYDRKSGNGIYLGTQDPTPNFMVVQIANAPDQITWTVGHFPPNIAFKEESFTLPYDCVAGPFRGDWFDASRIYRQWALKQSWARQGPLSKRKDMPRWYKESPLYFYTHLDDSYEGTFDLEKNMKIAADHFLEWTKWAGMPLGANFYAWKEYHPDQTTYNVPFNTSRQQFQGRWAGMATLNAHDGNYPKIPAISNFSDECKRLRAAGAMVCPYLCLEIFDQGADANSPYAAEARPNMVRDLYGAIRTWGSETSWQPCPATAWWQNRLKETCQIMLQREHVGGFYLDTMTGCAEPCYWVPHGHSAGGGSSSTVPRHQGVQLIHDAVKAKDPDVIISGENPAENMIDVIDGMLSLILTRDMRAPLLAAVYGDHVKRYGLTITNDGSDSFYLESASLFAEGTQVGMIALRPRPSISFQKPEHKGMIDFLGLIVGYYKQDMAKKFLAYGQLMRPLEFSQPSPMPMLAYRPILNANPADVGAQFPAVMSNVFRSEDGELGVIVVNAGAGEVRFKQALDPARYDMPAGASLDVEAIAPDGSTRNVSRGAAGVIPLEASLPGRQMVLFRVHPSVQR